MVRTITKTVFEFSELSESAKQTAREWYRANRDYDWASENLESLKKWADWMRVEITGHSLGGSDNRDNHVRWHLNIDSWMADLRGVRLWKFLNNQFNLPDLSGSCPFTGYRFDETLLNVFREFMARPWDASYRDLIRASIDKFVCDYSADVDYYYDDESIDESIEVNECEFYEDGSVF
jgi:hypothetical protein